VKLRHTVEAITSGLAGFGAAGIAGTIAPTPITSMWAWLILGIIGGTVAMACDLALQWTRHTEQEEEDD
jgi:hypothetical protein